MSDDPTEEQEILSERLGLFGRLDDAVYLIETVVVVVALVIMSVIVFTDIVFQFVLSLKQSIQRGESGAWTSIIGIAAFVSAVVFASTGPEPTLEGDEEEEEETPDLGIRIAKTAGVVVATAGGCLLLTYLRSSTVYRLMTVGFCVPVGLYYWRNDQTTRLGVLGVFTAFAVWAMGGLPEGYSWAQSYSLFLLLWVGFLGASMAARERRHLRVDLVRNLLPPRWVPHFNAFSYLVAAVATAVVCYLGYLYVFGPTSAYLSPIWEAPGWLPGFLQDQIPTGPPPDDMPLYDRILNVLFTRTPPGELPDWLKVLSLPVTMLILVLRFLGHSVVFAKLAIRGETYEPQTPGAH